METESFNQESALADLISVWQRCFASGTTVSPAELCRDRPELLSELERRIVVLEQMDALNKPLRTVDESTRVSTPSIFAEQKPQHIGRFAVERILGQGGFGTVYLARDDQLQRLVAIKMPHRYLVSRPEDAQAYLTEARTVAALDHPNVVPVYDVGSNEQYPVFIVSKYIEGTTLAQRIKDARPSLKEMVELVAIVAEALHHAHRKGLVHRDIKPGNILLDGSGKPFVADFGLALREQDVGKGSRFAGTPGYMSPEQARGEGHRVDGRSDIFSLGIVLYELLTGRQAFSAESIAELLAQITSREVRPPRQWDDTIPKELERICLKALSKRAMERYSTAKDLADDLRHFLEQATEEEKRFFRSRDFTAGAPSSILAPMSVPITPQTPTWESPPLKIVPKGLRSFDAYDADFFVDLLPGPRDRHGLPDSIRFWKTRIEEPDADSTFAVGLIYGPSGCGKSSFVKAGLLPRLGGHIVAIYIESTAGETESRLLNGLRKKCPTLSAELGLKEALAALRRGQGIPSGKKVLIILDQFEQWLHANKEESNTELVQALRQCDGSRVQSIVLVRDDFWMAATRFMRELEIRLIEGQNSAAVDLFDLDHARKVLAAYGRAFGRLPEKASETAKEAKEFLGRAVAGLAQEGKVISVRLALFAEMMKSRAWTAASLKAVGGTEGIGVTFLEETFSAATAPPEHRYHQKAARAVLKALLPDVGTDIKGHMRPLQELLEASGYADRPKDFEDLLRLLDSEIRLITPTDPEGPEEQGTPGGVNPRNSDMRYYQLTHDYLVPSLRSWLTRKQKETRPGRTELLLADRSAVWNARPENRQLPSLLQWLQIHWLTAKKSWTPPQRKMMAKATQIHVLRVVTLGVLLLLAVWGVNEGHSRLKAQALRDRLLDANINEVPAIVQEMSRYRRWLDPLLYNAYIQAANEKDRRKQLYSALALLPIDASQVNYLSERLLDAEPGEVSVLRDALSPHQDLLLDKLWSLVETPDIGREPQRLRAAAALAEYDPASANWAKCSALIANDLVRENPIFLLYWSEAYRPIRDSLLKPLAVIFRDQRPERAAERSLATNLLADYAADDPQVLADLLMDADDTQFAVIYPKLRDRGEQAVPVLTGEIDKKPPPDIPSSDVKREKLAKRQANAAVALLRMNHPEKVWPLLKHGPDPRVRSYLIHSLSPLGADAGAILKRLDGEPDLTVRRALILSLGEFGEKELPAVGRHSLLARLQSMYRREADPGLHAAVEWLLRTWQQQAWLKQVNDEWAKDRVQREKCLESIQQHLSKDKENLPPQWYVNSQGQTMVVIPGPVEFLMGSAMTEADRLEREVLHKRRITRTFALAAAPVTKEQFLRFRPTFTLTQTRFYPFPSCPIGGVVWHEAAMYCNWLSKVEGIPEQQWCYEINNNRVKLKPSYLSLSGYRLPTEAEMEYATRAKTLTSRYFGETEELLPKYAWYDKNSQQKTWPVGSLKPNDLGLFDVQGNVFTWCQESYKLYPKGEEVSDDHEDNLIIDDKHPRALRGGSFFNHATSVRSAYRECIVPGFASDDYGFRLARTFR